MDYFLNGLIFLITLLLVLAFFWKERKWNPGRVKKAFRFFTVQSNVFCAVAALLMCVCPGSRWIWLLKYVGTAAVTVTMVTVLLFLGPSIGRTRALLKGSDLFMHLITPLLALISFCGFERRGLRFPLALIGLLPTVLYGALYAYKLLIAPPSKAWKDFYGFNRRGKWYGSFALMLLQTLLICLILTVLQNLVL